jgi:Probable cobalt transporter subunit (CbtA)
MAVVMTLLPVVNETPKHFPATVLWQFRLASIGIQALLWACFGVVFGVLAERVLQPRTADSVQAAAQAPGAPSAA